MKRLAFALIAVVLPSVLLVLTAEYALRWRATGGPIAALRTYEVFQPERGRTTWLVEDPELGYKLDPASASINSFGIRHAELAPGEPASGTRVLVLGDSVAWDRDGFVALLRDGLAVASGAPTEVINASVPGYTTYQERLLLERDLLPLSPDLVLLQYCVNDNHRFLHRLDAGGHWILTPEAAGAGSGGAWLPGWVSESHLARRVRWQLLARERAEREARAAFPWVDSPEYGNAWRDETWADQQAQIRGLRDAATRGGARLAIVAFPYEPQLDARLLARDAEYTLKPQRKLAQLAARLEVPLLDLHPAFLAAETGPLFRDGLHPTAEGHALAAREILAFLERERLLAPRAPKAAGD